MPGIESASLRADVGKLRLAAALYAPLRRLDGDSRLPVSFLHH